VRDAAVVVSGKCERLDSPFTTAGVLLPQSVGLTFPSSPLPVARRFSWPLLATGRTRSIGRSTVWKLSSAAPRVAASSYCVAFAFALPLLLIIRGPLSLPPLPKDLDRGFR